MVGEPPNEIRPVRFNWQIREAAVEREGGKGDAANKLKHSLPDRHWAFGRNAKHHCRLFLAGFGFMRWLDHLILTKITLGR
jgi:hypothetical protein